MEELDQIERIKSKLFSAKNTDRNLKVFGAGSHKYILGNPVRPLDILNFENEYDLELPECYKSFLLHIGNGGISHSNSGAGPYYGIYSLGKNTDEFIYENTKSYLKEDCKISPKMSGEYWSDLNKNIEENDTISDEEFEIELGKIFSGLLPIGSQGCTYYHALVLNGEFKGRVVNVDIERQKPRFSFELNFLDWYERWLDEVISGDLIIDTPSWFGYKMGGSAAEILEKYISAKENETKIECLDGILNKPKISSENIGILEVQYKVSTGVIKDKLLQILTKFDYQRAKPYLIDFTKESLLSVFQFVFWYAKDKSSDWLEIIEANSEKINNEETFRFCTYLLKEMNIDYGNFIIPFTLNKSDNIKISAYYSLGQLENKIDYVDTFIVGLQDSSNKVIHAALQAVNGIKDKKLLVYYKMIAEKFPKEQDYILSNLNQNLKLFGLSTTTIKTINIDVINEKKWFEFWK
ncbi:SMI1/KNR4 family protein [Flavobacterium sp. ENC]|uniref:SMI1/KNR4 family protein n=1 Tax=Flavobacterium sp. ENC TaxID=2897330 RepID=UPI001E5D4774|nr:SMI1/KNR4 family protein [Flavobacterium sp. ENC]MCD0466506.1 SMI1/KNR4 family protein [Flavobacterium sp. ENC]